MPTLIGTNFSYKAEDFLDERIKLAKTEEDLKNWDIPVPEAFEICLGDSWYFYDSSVNLEKTGHWVPKVVDKTEDSIHPSQIPSANLVGELSDKVDTVSSDILSLNNSMYPCAITNIIAGSYFTTKQEVSNLETTVYAQLGSAISVGKYVEELDIDGNGVLDNLDRLTWTQFFSQAGSSVPAIGTNLTSTFLLDLGAYILPKITWKVVKPMITWELSGSSVSWKVVSGTLNNPAEVIESNIDGPTKGYVNDTTWISKELLHSTTRTTYTYQISSRTNSGTITGNAYYKFTPKTYYGSGSLDLWNLSTIKASDINGFNGKFVDGGTFPESSFNCSGGKYPYILIPSIFYNSSYKTYVSKNLNSDFVQKTVNLTNTFGTTSSYVMFRTSYIQTGSNIGIEIK
jgi:hypothetical protein